MARCRSPCEVCRSYERNVPPDIRDIYIDNQGVLPRSWVDSLRDVPGLGRRLLRQATVSNEKITSWSV